jgi:hypothetical protein
MREISQSCGRHAANPRQRCHNDEWHETEPGLSAAIAWRGRRRGTGGCHAKAENISQKKRSLVRFGAKSRRNSNAAPTRLEQRHEFRDRQPPHHRSFARSHLRRCNLALRELEAKFDCSAKPVIGRIRWLDSPAPHSVNRGSDEMHRPTGRRLRRSKTRNDIPGRIAQRESVPFTRERSKVRSLVRPPSNLMK